MTKHFAAARRKFKPNRIKYLLVAESPPQQGSSRFFYFERVTAHDSLFIETMKVLYGSRPANQIRPKKGRYLLRFSGDGFYLIDSVSCPLGQGRSDSAKQTLIRRGLPYLKGRARRLASADTKLILISKNVYCVCALPLKAAGFNVVNAEMIDFPSFNHAPDYRAKLTKALRRAGWRKFKR